MVVRAKMSAVMTMEMCKFLSGGNIFRSSIRSAGCNIMGRLRI